MTTGRQELLEHGQRRCIRRGSRTVYETKGRTQRKQRTPPLRATNAAVNSAGAAVPFEELRARRICRRTMLEYTAASGRLDHAAFRERQANASV
jgi:hypothetical protein